ncbi:MAG TPA: phospholipase D-like domain-containing protein [Acidimicrobiales bacterium]|nr:phospholipase D-like domain-containing protein [Acidimicrobiales bacterium]
MRFKSRKGAGGQVFAVAGVNTVSFAIVASDRTKDGLLGFAVERIDPARDERFFMPGFKVFRSVIPRPGSGLLVSSNEHPVQSFVWDDFTADPGHDYGYVFRPIKGRARKLDRTSAPLTIDVRTEPLISDTQHDVFFNRGVASSQAYTREFGLRPIAELAPADRERALAWLSRDLDEAVLRFIDACPAGDRLLGCFYEFRYRPVAERLQAAIARGVDVQLIVDAKVNEHTDKDGFHESFPRLENLALLADVGIPTANVHRREARKSNIQHNKFMVRVAAGTPTEVWTGSTNMSLGGIHGQTNVGHWLRNPEVAGRFRQYWELLAGDPGGQVGDSASVVKAKNKALRTDVEALSPVPTDLRTLPAGTTPVFSPRSTGSPVLESYAALLDGAADQACITLAFGIGAPFKNLLRDNTDQNPLVFMLLEKKDVPDPDKPGAFVKINASNNVYKAWGSFLQDPVYQWALETNAGLLGLNQHVSYIHSKFLLVDPLSADPTVVTGSANFSEASTEDNDENMLVIRGDTRVADIYLTEFNRLFNHYYFRSVTEATRHRPDAAATTADTLFLAEKADEWQARYAPGTLKAKRLAQFANMARFTRLP